MRRHHPENERTKREYFVYLEKAKRMSPSSIDQVAAAIALFEESTGYRHFRKFHVAQAVAFQDRLRRHLNPETGKPLAKATILSRLAAMKAFIIWLAGRAGYRSRISYADADYFNVSANDERIAKAARPRQMPSIEEIRRAIAVMPTDTKMQRRDRAVVSHVPPPIRTLHPLKGRFGRSAHEARAEADESARLFDTRWLQEALKQLGSPDLLVDGEYGGATMAAVKRFQATHPPLRVDGWAGVQTCATVAIELEKRKGKDE